MSSGYQVVLLEDINGKLDAILEGQANAPLLARFNSMDKRLQRVESDVVVIKAVLTDQSRVLNEHSDILNKHSTILNQHSAILNEHSDILNQHSEKLDGLECTLNAS